METHLAGCHYRKVTCPNPHCGEEMLHIELDSHLVELHPNAMRIQKLEATTFIWKTSIRPGMKLDKTKAVEMRVLTLQPEETFFVVGKVGKKSIKLWVIFHGRTIDTQNFKYQLTMEKDENFSFCGEMNNLNTKAEDILKTGQFLKIPIQKVRNLLAEGDDTLAVHVKIIRLKDYEPPYTIRIKPKKTDHFQK